MSNQFIKRGDIFYADLGDAQGSEQGGIRPVLIIQNDIGNKHSPTVIVAAITSKVNKSKLPTHVFLEKGRGGLNRDSIVLMEQIRTIDKDIKLKGKIGRLSYIDMLKINIAVASSFGLAIIREFFEVDNDIVPSPNNNQVSSVA